MRNSNVLVFVAALAGATSSLRAQLPRVALCAAESSSTACQFLDPQSRLLATNLFSAVDIINVTATGGGTPTLAQLLQYARCCAGRTARRPATSLGVTCSPTTSTRAVVSWSRRSPTARRRLAATSMVGGRTATR